LSIHRRQVENIFNVAIALDGGALDLPRQRLRRELRLARAGLVINGDIMTTTTSQNPPLLAPRPGTPRTSACLLLKRSCSIGAWLVAPLIPGFPITQILVTAVPEPGGVFSSSAKAAWDR
jgi:hypothetical protein